MTQKDIVQKETAPAPQQVSNSSLRSEAAQELINRRGGFIEQKALLLFVGLLCLLLAGTWFIRYPDIIHARALLTARNAPKEMVGVQPGRLVKLFVKNGDEVQRGQMLGWIESTADAQQVIALSHAIDSSTALAVGGHFEPIPSLLNVRVTGLGELQSPYQLFIVALQEYEDYWVNGYYSQRKRMLQRDIVSLQQKTGLLKEQKQLSIEERDSARKSLQMNRILLDQKVISPEEYRVAVSKFNSKQMALPQYDENLLSNAGQQRAKQKEIAQLEHDRKQQQIAFTQALQTFKSSIDEWLRRYTLRAPLSGKIVFVMPLQQNKYIEAGRLIAYVNPADSRYYARMYLPQRNFGKVDSGMSVQLRLDAYPYQEAGFIRAHISYISPIATDSGFLAQAVIDHHPNDAVARGQMVSSQGKPIQYRNGLSAQALVITRNMRLLERIYYNIIKSFSPK